MKAIKKKWPVYLMPLVIIPGLIISVLGVYLVSQQKSARLIEIKRQYSNRMILLRDSVETGTRQLMGDVFRQLTDKAITSTPPTALQGDVKSILLNHGIVKYPFFIRSPGDFLFPFTREATFSTLQSPVLNLETLIKSKSILALYKKAYNLEYRERDFVVAIKGYLACLDRQPTQAVKPYLFNAIGGCYFKLNRFRSALMYYNKTLNRYPILVKGDHFLYFTMLRQLALSNKHIGAKSEAFRWYLRLYEEVPPETSDQQGTYSFYKNEALDYLNRNHQEDNSSEQQTRFIKAKAMAKLDKASPIDISLKWLYFDTGQGNLDTQGDESRFLKLKEFYESDDEKVRFYKSLRAVDYWQQVPNISNTSSIQVKQLRQSSVTGTAVICFKPLVTRTNRSPEGSQKTVYFGFLLSFDHITKNLLPTLLHQHIPDSGLFLSFRERGQMGLLSVSFGSFFSGKTLTLHSNDPDYFESLVRKDIRLYYFLLVSLVLILGLGIFLFYKYLSREAQLVQMKSDFVDSASHTLKTPLTRMSLLAENVSQEWVTDEVQKKEFFETIVSETHRMSEMIDNMLNFSRIEAGKQQYESETFYFQESLTAVIDQYKKHLENLGFRFEVFIDELLPPIDMDKKAAKLIIANVLHNAIKYSPGNKYIRVQLSVEHQWLVLSVQDRGIGIAKEHLPLLFKKFSRVPDDRVQVIEGSGLGLFLVKHALDAHEGRIEVESLANQGTTFKVFLKCRGTE
jgi:signal transduction histidine kinase